MKSGIDVSCCRVDEDRRIAEDHPDKRRDCPHNPAYFAGMNIADLTLIQDIARHGSFAAVGRERDMDPSSIGRTIAAIEEELGFRLFARTTRRMEVTEAGALYLARISPLSEELERAVDECRAMQVEPRGTLRISASATFGQRVIVPRLLAFRKAYPAVSIEGIFSDSTIELVTERIDLAIRLAPAIDGDYVVSKLMDTRYSVVAAPAYLRQAPPWKDQKTWRVTGPSSFHIGTTGPNGPFATSMGPSLSRTSTAT